MNHQRLLLLLLPFTNAIFAQHAPKTVPLTDLSQLEGRYNVLPMRDTIEASLEWIAMMEPHLDMRYFRDKKCHIAVQKTRQNRLVFSLWEGDKKWASSYMKGRVKDGKIHVKKTKLWLFTLLFNVIRIHHATLALSENGDLIVSDANLGGLVMVVFVPLTGASDEPRTLFFERVQNH